MEGTSEDYLRGGLPSVPEVKETQYGWEHGVFGLALSWLDLCYGWMCAVWWRACRWVVFWRDVGTPVGPRKMMATSSRSGLGIGSGHSTGMSLSPGKKRVGSGGNRPSPSPSRSVSRTSTPQARWARRKKKVLILDLDETLVHSTSRPSVSDRGGIVAPEHVVEVMVDGHACLYYVAKRPHTDHFLRKVNEWYEVVLFTASMAEYADPVCDWLDPERQLLRRRYFREHCTPRGPNFVKDLARIEPDLRNVILVDNSAFSYALHKENGIPIDSWFDTADDESLLDLLPVLDALRFVEDVRCILGLRLMRG